MKCFLMCMFATLAGITTSMCGISAVDNTGMYFLINVPLVVCFNTLVSLIK